jgi:hypothetical protein
MAVNQSKILQDLDERAYWLLYLDKLTDWLWQDNEDSVRWTLILDDTRPSTTLLGQQLA